MKILYYNDYIKESLVNNDGILLIVDVQSNFQKFIPDGFVKKLSDYCKEFDDIHQIWDSNQTNKPTYKFPNQKGKIEKRFGVKRFYKKKNKSLDEWLFEIFDENVANNILKMIDNKTIKEGDKFKLKEKDSYLVYINNNHNWFYVNKNLVKLFKKLKNKVVVVVGGADSECLKDVYVSARSFNVKTIYNHEFIYSAETQKTK